MRHCDAQCSVTHDVLVVMHVCMMHVKQPHMNRSDTARPVGGSQERLGRPNVHAAVGHHRRKSTVSVRYLSLGRLEMDPAPAEVSFPRGKEKRPPPLIHAEGHAGRKRTRRQVATTATPTDTDGDFLSLRTDDAAEADRAVLRQWNNTSQIEVGTTFLGYVTRVTAHETHVALPLGLQGVIPSPNGSDTAVDRARWQPGSAVRVAVTAVRTERHGDASARVNTTTRHAPQSTLVLSAAPALVNRGATLSTTLSSYGLLQVRIRQPEGEHGGRYSVEVFGDAAANDARVLLQDAPPDLPPGTVLWAVPLCFDERRRTARLTAERDAVLEAVTHLDGPLSSLSAGMRVEAQRSRSVVSPARGQAPQRFGGGSPTGGAPAGGGSGTATAVADLATGTGDAPGGAAIAIGHGAGAARPVPPRHHGDPGGTARGCLLPGDHLSAVVAVRAAVAPARWHRQTRRPGIPGGHPCASGSRVTSPSDRRHGGGVAAAVGAGAGTVVDAVVLAVDPLADQLYVSDRAKLVQLAPWYWWAEPVAPICTVAEGALTGTVELVLPDYAVVRIDRCLVLLSRQEVNAGDAERPLAIGQTVSVLPDDRRRPTEAAAATEAWWTRAWTVRAPAASTTDGRPSTCLSFRIGDRVRDALVTAIHPFQVNVRVQAAGVHVGRIHITHVDASEQWEQLSVGQVVPWARVVDVRERHRLELSLRAIDLETPGSSGDHPGETAGRDTPTVGAQYARGVVKSVEWDGGDRARATAAWVMLTPKVTARITAFDAQPQRLEQWAPGTEVHEVLVYRVDATTRHYDAALCASLRPGQRIDHATVVAVRARDGEVWVQLPGDRLGTLPFACVTAADATTEAYPLRCLHPGQSLSVFVIDGTDPAHPERPLLSLDPQRVPPAVEQLRPGEAVDALVRHVDAHGAFFHIAPGVIGRCLLRDLSSGFVRDPSTAFPVGMRVRATVLSVDAAARRVQLTLRDAAPARTAAYLTAALSVGKVTSGTVSGVTEYGVFVELPGLNIRVCGLCHRSELRDALPPPSAADIAEAYRVGQRVQVRVLAVNAKGQVALSLKASQVQKEEAEMADVESEPESTGAESEVEELASAPPQKPHLRWSGTEPADGISSSSSDSPSTADKAACGRGDRRPASAHAAFPRPSFALTETEFREQQLVAALEQPQTPEDFERALLGRPNDASLWVSYLAMRAAAGEVNKALALAERALETVHFREDAQRLRLWLAYLNLARHATPGMHPLDNELFRRAVQNCDGQTLHLRYARALEAAGDGRAAEQVYLQACRRYGKHSERVWIECGAFYMLRQSHAGCCCFCCRRRRLHAHSRCRGAHRGQPARVCADGAPVRGAAVRPSAAGQAADGHRVALSSADGGRAPKAGGADGPAQPGGHRPAAAARPLRSAPRRPHRRLGEWSRAGHAPTETAGVDIGRSVRVTVTAVDAAGRRLQLRLRTDNDAAPIAACPFARAAGVGAATGRCHRRGVGGGGRGAAAARAPHRFRHAAAGVGQWGWFAGVGRRGSGAVGGRAGWPGADGVASTRVADGRTAWIVVGGYSERHGGARHRYITKLASHWVCGVVCGQRGGRAGAAGDVGGAGVLSTGAGGRSVRTRPGAVAATGSSGVVAAAMVAAGQSWTALYRDVRSLAGFFREQQRLCSRRGREWPHPPPGTVVQGTVMEAGAPSSEPRVIWLQPSRGCGARAHDTGEPDSVVPGAVGFMERVPGYGVGADAAAAVRAAAVDRAASVPALHRIAQFEPEKGQALFQALPAGRTDARRRCLGGA
eukprot:ctg_670.g285